MTEQTIKNEIHAKGRIHVCGVTCHKGDANCNGYCTDPKVPHAKLIEASPAESSIEAEIVAKGLTAPRVTPDQIDAMMARVVYRHVGFEGTTSIIVAAFLDSEFYLGCGHSACVSKANFDPDIGFKIAKVSAEKLARDKLWELEGYFLRRNLPANATLNG